MLKMRKIQELKKIAMTIAVIVAVATKASFGFASDLQFQSGPLSDRQNCTFTNDATTGKVTVSNSNECKSQSVKLAENIESALKAADEGGADEATAKVAKYYRNLKGDPVAKATIELYDAEKKFEQSPQNDTELFNNRTKKTNNFNKVIKNWANDYDANTTNLKFNQWEFRTNEKVTDKDIDKDIEDAIAAFDKAKEDFATATAEDAAEDADATTAKETLAKATKKVSDLLSKHIADSEKVKKPSYASDQQNPAHKLTGVILEKKAAEGVATAVSENYNHTVKNANDIASLQNSTTNEIKQASEQISGQVATNKDSITINATGISKNKGDIAKNVGAIKTNATGISQNSQRIGNNEKNINTNETNIAKNTKEIGRLSDDIDVIRSGVAASLAVAAMPVLSREGWGAAVGTGYFDGESAIAAGLTYSSNAYHLKFAVGHSGGHNAASAGATWAF